MKLKVDRDSLLRTGAGLMLSLVYSAVRTGSWSLNQLMLEITVLIYVMHLAINFVEKRGNRL